jgi:hypothetical protein
VRSGAKVLDELCDQTRNAEQQNYMNAAAFMQQNCQDEPNKESERAGNPKHRAIMLWKL